MIKTLTIEHFRGFYAAKTLEFGVPNDSPGSGLTILVGPNGSGKTSVAEALRLLARKTASIDIEQRHEGHGVKISVSDDQQRQKTLTNPDLGSTTRIDGDQNALSIDQLRFVPARRAWNPYSRTGIQTSQMYWPNTELQQTQTMPRDDHFVGRIADLSEQERVEFGKILKMVLPNLADWRIDSSQGQNFIRYATIKGASHSAEVIGEGTASLFRIALAIYDSMVADERKCILIDEPELSLHPQAQKRLALYLSEAASHQQIIVATHSPYFVTWDGLAAGARIYRLSGTDRGVNVKSLSRETIDHLQGPISDWQKPHLLDPVAREVFFADDMVFVEGQEDAGLLRNFVRSNSLGPFEVFGYGVGGAGNMARFLKMAQELGIKAAAIYDGNQDAEAEKAERCFPEFLIEKLPVPDIRDKMRRDCKGRETAEVEKKGLFCKDGSIKPQWKCYLVDLIKKVQRSFKDSACRA